MDVSRLTLVVVALIVVSIILYMYSNLSQSHLSCVNNKCVSVKGFGANACVFSSDCEKAAPPSTIYYVPSYPSSLTDPVAEFDKACVNRLNNATAHRNLLDCMIPGCDLTTAFCLLSVDDNDCWNLVRGTGGNASKQGYCDHNFAFRSSNEASCSDAYNAKETCLSVHEKNVSRCDLETSSYYSLYCKNLVAVFSKNPSLCEGGDTQECKALINNSVG